MGLFGWGTKGMGMSGTSQPRHEMAAIGTWVHCHIYDLSVAAFDLHVYVGPNPPAEGSELYTALIDVVNTDTKQAHYADHQWRLYDREHFSYSPVSSHYCRKPALGNSYLAPGAPVRGYITFELPKNTIPARLAFSDYHGVAEFALPAFPDPSSPV